MSEIDTEQFKKIVKAIRIAEVAGINVTLTPEECAYLYSVFDNLNAEIGQMEADLTRRDEIIRRLKEDGDRLASTYVIEVFPHEWVCRGGCHHWARFGEQIEHSPDCPITLHRALMKEVEG